MEFLERVQTAIQNDASVWPYGADPEKISEDAARAWRVLSEVELLAISRHNPFRAERDKAIYHLHKMGLTHRILAELSGFSKRKIELTTPKIREENGE